MTKGPGSPGRLLAFDAARGIAMLGVFVSHFGLVIQRYQPVAANQLRLIGMYASPTFILVSGTMLGYLLSGSNAETSRLKVRLVDRALFLLLVCHVLIMIALYHRGPNHPAQFVQFFMTDTIAASVLMGVYLVPRLSPSRRLALAVFMYSLSWFAVITWLPSRQMENLLKECLVGSIDGSASNANATFSLVPWAAMYLAGTVLGDALSRVQAKLRSTDIGVRFIASGGVAIFSATVIKTAYLELRPTAWASPAEMPRFWNLLYNLTTPFDKYPPGPVYFLAYGGLGLMLIGCCVLAVEWDSLRPVMNFAETLGRASLPIFIVQFYVYYVGVARLPLNHPAMLPLIFVATVALLWAFARGWRRWGGNHLLTVGLGRFPRPWPARQVVPFSK